MLSLSSPRPSLAYYAGPGNKFWPTLFRVGLTPRQLAPAECRSLLQYGIGLTDIAKGVSGSDSSLPRDSYDREGLRRRQLRRLTYRNSARLLIEMNWLLVPQ